VEETKSPKIMLTEEGYQRLSKRVEKEQEKMQQAREDMSRAADYGDLSENAGYMAAKESYNNHRKSLNELQDVLSEARVVEEDEITTDSVDFGTTVTVKDLDDDEEYSYRIVGSQEARMEKGEISVKSPVAQSLLGKETGEKVQVKTPAGESRYEIIEIST